MGASVLIFNGAVFNLQFSGAETRFALSTRTNLLRLALRLMGLPNGSHVQDAVCLRLVILFADDDVPEHFVVPHRQSHFLLEGVTCCAICTKEVDCNFPDRLFRPVTSVAANYAEASEPESDADFIRKLKVSLKELKGTRVWLRFAKELLRDGSADDIVAETFEIARMMGASMRKRGYSGWASA